MEKRGNYFLHCNYWEKIKNVETSLQPSIQFKEALIWWFESKKGPGTNEKNGLNYFEGNKIHKQHYTITFKAR